MRVNILGCGVMGSQIAGLMSILGYDVQVWNRSNDAKVKDKLNNAIRLIKRSVKGTGSTGNISFVDSITDLMPALTIESLIEDLDFKKELIKSLPYDVSSCGLLTNTSSIDPEKIYPNAIGFHFYNPIYAVKLIEISKNINDLSSSLKALVQHIKDSGFDVIEVNHNAGYIGNYILFQEISAAFKLVDIYGYDCVQIDKITFALGRQSSIFDIIDLIGIDVAKLIMGNLHGIDASFYVSPCFERALTGGVYGRKNRTSIRSIL